MHFLTPAKVTLLVLIDMYVNNEIPRAAHRPVLDFLTMHTMDIDLPALLHKLSPKKTQSQVSRIRSVEATVQIVASISVFQDVLSRLEWKTTADGKKQTLWDAFLRRLWKVDSLNEFHVFVITRPQCLIRRWADPNESAPATEPQSDTENEAEAQSASQSIASKRRRRLRLSHNSPFGQFVRTCRLDMQRQTFQETTKLWQLFIEYRQPTAAQMRAMSSSLGKYGFDVVLDKATESGWSSDGAKALADVAYGDMLKGIPPDGVAVSTHDVENLVEFQVQRMHSFGCQVPLEVRHQFEDMARDAKIVPSKAHYLRYLEAWRAGNYTTAFDQVYRFFDYSLNNNDRQSYQMALMTLAVINSDFGCYDDALTAMLEAISTARENGDVHTLNMCLRWLFRFDLNQPALMRALDSSTMLTNMHETFAYLKSKSAEVGMIPLIVSTYFLEADYGLTIGDSLATVAECMMRACYLIASKNLPGCFGGKAATGSKIWRRMGVAVLSQLECEIFLRVGATAGNLSDTVQVTIERANQYAQKGEFESALDLVRSLETRFHGLMMPDISEAIVRTTQCIHAHQNLMDGRLFEADEVIALLAQEPEDLPQAISAHHFLQLDSMYRRGAFPKALDRIEEMLSSLDAGTNDISTQLRLMLCKVRIFNRCNKPLRGLTVCLRAATLAMNTRAVPFMCEAAGLLANIMNALGEYEAAQSLLDAAIPRLTETESSALIGEMYMILADSYMGVAGEAAVPARESSPSTTTASPLSSAASSPTTTAVPSTPPMRPRSPSEEPPALQLTAEQIRKAVVRNMGFDLDLGNAREALDNALWAMDRALEYFQQTGDRESEAQALAKKATALKIGGDHEKAEIAASRYLQVKMA
uniref:Anaphase-promoting complex subunit 5 n=1 Tax=Thielaviopsis punctulata TaxID=72032 RepID=A0A288REI9_9PEZI|nr:putative anaphase-promoting complex protein [Thielaviopsis punctulata]